MSPDGKILAFEKHYDIVQLWNLDGTKLKEIEGQNPVFNPKREMLATLLDGGVIQLWNFNGKKLNSFESVDNDLSFRFSPDGKILAIQNNDEIRLIRIDDGQERPKIDGCSWFNFSPDSNLIACSNDSDSKLMNLAGNVIKEIEGEKPVLVLMENLLLL